jgi:hypothetical protein
LCRFISLGRINKGMDDGEFHPSFVINQPSAFSTQRAFQENRRARAHIQFAGHLKT